ncbi:MAG: HipA domain-containing protein [Pseudomonadota bacterium]
MEHQLSHQLNLWANGQKVATLFYAAKDDLWSLEYAPSWMAAANAFPLSPILSFVPPKGGYAPGAIKRFVENLLPEGRALDISATTYSVSKNNIFALINALGIETAGAFQFSATEPNKDPSNTGTLREISLAELNERLSQREHIPFVVWDGKVRMSIAGYQDKLTVYLDKPIDQGGRIYLPSPPLASTHILKPESLQASMPYLVANEHYCMKLALRMGFPVADVSILRSPRPILVVKRFDREVMVTGTENTVTRLHIIDACQASDLPVSFKYERNLGSSEQVQNIREGMSFEKLFARVEQTTDKAAAKMILLRWSLFQFLIGNCNAHGKNFSFFVKPEGLVPAPWYDLVSVVQYPTISHELAMAFGDVFQLEDIKGFALADFAKRCGIARSLLKREATKIANNALKYAKELALAPEYTEDERKFVISLSEFIVQQASHLKELASEAAKIDESFL